jgi:hypothetical protein
MTKMVHTTQKIKHKKKGKPDRMSKERGVMYFVKKPVINAF